MAQSDLRIEIEQPQVFFYFPNDKNVYICVIPCSSSVIFYLFSFGIPHFSSMKTQMVTYESCSCVSGLVWES